MSTGLFRVVPRQVARQKGSGTHEGHLAPEHAEELGEFVEGRGAQPASKGDEANGIGEEVSRRVPFIGHGPELGHPEDPTQQTGAILTEEDGGTEAKTDKEGDQREDGNPEGRCRKEQEQVEEALGGRKAPGCSVASHAGPGRDPGGRIRQ